MGALVYDDMADEGTVRGTWYRCKSECNDLGSGRVRDVSPKVTAADRMEPGPIPIVAFEALKGTVGYDTSGSVQE